MLLTLSTSSDTNSEYSSSAMPCASFVVGDCPSSKDSAAHNKSGSHTLPCRSGMTAHKMVCPEKRCCLLLKVSQHMAAGAAVLDSLERL